MSTNQFPDPYNRVKSEDSQEPDKRRRATEMVRRFMRRSDEYRRPFLELAEKASALYRCWEATSKSAINRANLRLPYGYLIVETEVPQTANAFLKFKPPFKLKGRTVSDMQWENDVTDFFGMQLDQMNFGPKFLSFLKSETIEGTAIAKVPYKYKEQVITRRVTQVDPMFGIPIAMKQKQLETMFDGPDFEYVPLADFFPDWSVRTPGDVEAMRGCVHRTWKTLPELKSSERRGEKGTYSNLDELERSLTHKGCDAWKDPYYKSNEYGTSREDSDAKKKPIEIWEYWGLFDPNNDGSFVEHIVTIANGDVVIRCEENFYDYRFKPFVASVNVPQPGEFYGASELFAVQGSIKEATALRNARLDQINLAVNRQWVVDRAAGINARALYARPNGIIWANDVKGIQPLPPPEVPASAFREVQELGSEIQQTAGSNAGPSLSEAGRVFGRSATGASFVSGISASRSAVKTKLLSDTFFRRLVKIMMMTNAQFVTDEQWVRSNDPNRPNPFTQLPSDAFHCDYDFEVLAGVEADPQDEFQRLQTSMQFFQVAESTQPGIIKWDAVFDQIGRDLLGRGYKKFVRSDQERQQLQMQNMMNEQSANAMAGQMAPQPNGAGGEGSQT
jgi:hypothetical protein